MLLIASRESSKKSTIYGTMITKNEFRRYVTI